MADAAEPFRQHVKEKATNELVGVDDHHLGLVVRAIILPTEVDATVLAGEEPAIGDRDAMGIAPEIIQHLLRAAKRTLGIDIPFDLAQRPEMPGERTPAPSKLSEITEEHELFFVECCLQALQEQPPIQSRQDANREEEVGPAADPASVGCEAAARHESVDVRMMAPTPTIP